MGDSDDEYDRRRVRDKFRGERSEYEQRRPRGDYRDRRDWGDRRGRDSWSGGRDQGWERKRGGQYYGRPRRDSEGGDGQISPPNKRSRRDWDSSYDKGFSSGGMGQSGGMWGGGRGPLMQQHQSGDSSKQGMGDMSSDMKGSHAPKMMTFKSFLMAQEDSIDEDEAVRRYHEYKTEFKRTQLSDFFVMHKDEEWFKNKYHPIDAKTQEKEKRHAVKKRLRIFLDMLDAGLVENFTLEGQCSDAIVKFLDSVAIRLEGGSADDLAVLDEKSENAQGGGKGLETKGEFESKAEQPVSPSSVPLPSAPPPSKDNKKEANSEKRRKSSKDADYIAEAGSENESADTSEPAPPGEDGAIDDDASGQEPDANIVNTAADPGEPSQKEEEGEEEEGESDPGPPGVDNPSDELGQEATKENKSDVASDAKDDDVVKKKRDGRKEKSKEKGEKKSNKRDWERKKGTGLGAFMSTMRDEGNEDSDSDSESEEEEEEEEDEEEEESEETKKTVPLDEFVEEKKVEDQEEEREEGREPEQRELHKTLSLFMRSVPPSISKADIAAVCKRYPGFLRVALADPSPERSFYRRGWVTFDNNVNIKDVCWNLSNIRIKDSELNPVVNRDLSKRIRPISGITMAKRVVCFDIQFSAELIKALDDKISLYSKEQEEEEDKDQTAMEVEEEPVEENGEEKRTTVVGSNLNTSEVTLPDENPLLVSLPQMKDLVVDEEEQIGNEEEGEVKTKVVDLTRDDSLMKALDKLVLYLRIVHSIDYYNGSDYPHEDEMPNRCGILHVRGEKPERPNSSEVTDWQTNTRQKMKHYLERADERLGDDEVQKLGKKNVNEEVENFIESNALELAKDKWLCPLSGKKFRAKEFVIKHIHNKHSDKLKAVRLEVEFFNNYLADPKRPHFFESSPSKSGGSSGQYNHPQQALGPGMGWNLRGPMGIYGGPRAPFTPPSYGGGFQTGPEAYNRGGGIYQPKSSRVGMASRDRKVVHYKDLDAPDDMDFF